jgi:hypothetical protein
VQVATIQLEKISGEVEAGTSLFAVVMIGMAVVVKDNPFAAARRGFRRAERR